jgi:acetylglutamate kinase
VTPLVLKFGGELLESPDQRASAARLVASLAAARPLVVVHGGGRAIDAALDRLGIAPRKVDGLRVTDPPTLDVVVSVLAGSANTALVAALVAAGVRAVGLTGADAGVGRAVRVGTHRATSGTTVDLGLVGDPIDADAALVQLLVANGYVPVVASIGFDGRDLLNVNADVMACRLAAATGSDLVIAGTTPGVLDGDGRTIASLDDDAIDRLIASGTATAGMIAKLSAARQALANGAPAVRLIDGRGIDSARALDAAPGTELNGQAAVMR